MSGHLVAGVDSSTQATKVVVVRPEDGSIVASARAPHAVEGTDGARETDPEVWWNALRQALAQTGCSDDIGAISVAGQQHGLVVLDAARLPLRRAILWNDTRSAQDANDLTESLGPRTWATRCGSRPVAAFTVAKWAWLRRIEPGIAARTAFVRLPHDYLTERLSGVAITDRGDASGTGWWSPTDEGYARDILELPAVELAVEGLPPIAGPEDEAGPIRRSAAIDLGLRTDVHVGPGTGDNMSAALGLGLRVGQAVMSLGTSGTVFAKSDRPSADPTGIVAGFADATGSFLPLACTLNCTMAVDRMASWLGIDRDDVAESGSALVLPYLDGERTPDVPHATGLILGLRHTTRPQQILMATYEGAIASLLVGLDAIEASTEGLDPDAALTLVGGGAKGRSWLAAVRRLSGRPVLVPNADEPVALGAAVQATSIRYGEGLQSVARRWRTDSGTLFDPLPADEATLYRIARARAVVVADDRLSGGS